MPIETTTIDVLSAPAIFLALIFFNIAPPVFFVIAIKMNHFCIFIA
jgi:hypothetical protein